MSLVYTFLYFQAPWAQRPHIHCEEKKIFKDGRPKLFRGYGNQTHHIVIQPYE